MTSSNEERQASAKLLKFGKRVRSAVEKKHPITEKQFEKLREIAKARITERLEEKKRQEQKVKEGLEQKKEAKKQSDSQSHGQRESN